MPSTPITPKLQALFDGLNHPEEPQPREGKPGDPQLSALCQLLIQADLDRTGVIVDFGSGNGVLPEHLDRVWPREKPVPEYWAVDLPDMLDRLSLPSRIHNNSRKHSVGEFYSDALPRHASRIALVVVRNTIHELDIQATAELFGALRRHLPASSHIYIQDMARLMKPERRNVAWSQDILYSCLIDIGFEITGKFGLSSHGGTPWFGMLCHPRDSAREHDCRASVAQHRAKEQDRLLQKLKHASKGFDQADELMMLQNEYSALSVQLSDAGWLPAQPIHEPAFERIGIAIHPPNAGQLEYACYAGDEMAGKTGLIAILSNKRLLDFPAIYRSAAKQLAFGGYSNRPLFLKDANTSGLETAIDAGVGIRVMVVDPKSEAARLRSEEPIYDRPAGFIDDIEGTISRGREFFRRMLRKHPAEIVRKRFQLRASSRVPRWSYFIVDDTCYLSFYSIALTGSSAPCFVFRALPEANNNYFHAVQKEFSDLFNEAADLLDGVQ